LFKKNSVTIDMAKRVIFITGYKRSGKDTLYNRYPDWSHVNIYVAHKTVLPDWLFEEKTPVRLAFADKLKKQAREALHLPESLDIDAVKDTLKVDGKTLREHMKEIAISHRVQNDQYYAQAVKDQITEEKTLYMITDWRFKIEYDIIQPVLTARIFRKEVPIPAPSDKTEHELDTFKTDIVFVPHGDWRACVRQFPQYRGYIRYRRPDIQECSRSRKRPRPTSGSSPQMKKSIPGTSLT